MYFRCSNCLSSTWLDRIEPVRDAETVVCDECESRFTARPIPGLGTTIGEHYQRASRLTKEQGLDMATAYSVLLGLMSIEEVRLLQGERDSSPASAPTSGNAPATACKNTPESSIAPVLLEVDPAFADAIAAGCLTEQEAFRRGDRQAYAVRLSEKHGISIDLAYRVTDNRIGLGEARKRRPAPKAPARRARSTTFLQGAIVMVLASSITSTAAWRLWKQEFEPVRSEPSGINALVPPPSETYVPVAPPLSSDAPVDRVLPGVELLTDSAGRPTRITAPDPTAVLIEFCRKKDPLARLEPLRIVETNPSSPEARLGIFRDYDSLGTEHAVRIRRDWRTRRWSAGNGTHPITAMDATGREGAVLRASIEPRPGG